MSDIRKQSLECPVRHGQPVGRQNVQELLGRELPESADDFDCFDEGDEDRTSLRLGPQHPATHGVLRLDLELEGETILSCDPQVGYLHRGFEKMAETFTYAQALTLTDRLDYIAAMSNNTGYCLAVEKLLGVQAPLRARYIRTIACEMSRLCSHLLWLATHALDIGAMTVFLYCFREREMLLDLFEDLCGARLTLTYPRIGGVRQDVTGRFMDGLQDFLNIFPKRIVENETLLDTNRIWLQRTVGVGVVSPERALSLGMTGPMLRGSGIAWDLRKKQPYEVYDRMDFDIPVGKTGDTYDRYLVRMEEMKQSNRIIKQCVDWLRVNPGPVITDNHKVAPPSRESMKTNMEELIHHFKLFTEGMHVPPGEVYAAVEHPKGEFGIYLVSDGANKPYRLKIRAPGFAHLAAMDEMASGHMLADAVAIIGTMDIVFGEIDR